MSITADQRATALAMARTFRFNPEQLQKFSELIGPDLSLVQAVAEDGVPEVDKVAATLRGVRGLSPAQREAVLSAMKKGGHVSGDISNRALFASAERPGVEVRTPIEAMSASANNGELVRNLKARCRRFGFDLKLDQKIDPFALNDALSKGRVSTEERVALKSHLASLQLLA
jgi:hypothetical protein